MESSNILVLGSGGREHAICWHLKETGFSVQCAPGSDGISQICSTWSFSNNEDLLREIKSRKITQVIIGPEIYLYNGTSDFLESQNIKVFGPSKAAAQLETDKAFAKIFCKKNEIPTSTFEEVHTSEELKQALQRFSPPFVVKATGLAAGKGVLVTRDINDALQFGQRWLNESQNLIVEDFVQGRELSVFYMVDGSRYQFIGQAQDHKRLLDQDQGPNTGGMGSFSSESLCSENLRRKIEEEILQPTLKGLKNLDLHYRGFLFLGLMIDSADSISLLEYNCRLGDPETQSILMRLKTPLPRIIDDLSKGQVPRIEILSETSMNVVVAAQGYPEKARTGFSLGNLWNDSSCLIFHSGTRLQAGEFKAHGGRLFSVAATDRSLEGCRNRIYPWIEDWLENSENQNQVHFRKDIGQVSKEKENR